MASPVVVLNPSDVHNPPQGMINSVLNPQNLDADNSDVPAFLQPIAQQSSTITRTPFKLSSSLDAMSGQEDIAAVNPLPGLNKIINVYNPSLYSSDVRAHELTHELQYKTGLTSNALSEARDSKYDYGGEEELRDSHRPITDFNAEQQAQIVQDAVRRNKELQMSAQQKKSPASVAQEYDDLKKDYHPYLRQLNAANQKTIDVTPEAPGPPPSTLTGALKPDPLIGGHTVYLQSSDVHNPPPKKKQEDK